MFINFTLCSGGCAAIFYIWEENCKNFLNWLVYVENLLKLLSKDTKAINMTFNMLFCMLITHNRAEQCIFKSLRNVHIQTYLRFKIWKNMKGGHLCPLYDHLLRNGSKLGYLSCNFVSNEGILFWKWVSKPINLHEIFLSVSMKVHWSYIFIEKYM